MLESREEQYYYDKTDYQLVSQVESDESDESGESGESDELGEDVVRVKIHHNCLLPDHVYSFSVHCVYNELKITSPVVVTGVHTEGEDAPENDLLYHSCCYAHVEEKEENVNLVTRDLAILSVHRQSRSLSLFSPVQALNLTIPLRSICSVTLLTQEVCDGVLVVVGAWRGTQC